MTTTAPDPTCSALWRGSHRFEASAVAIADRHYNRQRVGTNQFMPPGRTCVLVSVDGTAVWGSLHQEHALHAFPGAWVCSIFRNEGKSLSSELIVAACAATRAAWGEPPAHGMITFVNPGAVRRKRDPGRCFRKAGFEWVGCTLGGHGRPWLAVLQLAAASFPAPVAAVRPQLGLFG